MYGTSFIIKLIQMSCRYLSRISRPRQDVAALRDMQLTGTRIRSALHSAASTCARSSHIRKSFVAG